MTKQKYEVIWNVTTRLKFQFDTKQEAEAFRKQLIRTGNAGHTYVLKNTEEITEPFKHNNYTTHIIPQDDAKVLDD